MISARAGTPSPRELTPFSTTAILSAFRTGKAEVSVYLASDKVVRHLPVENLFEM